MVKRAQVIVLCLLLALSVLPQGVIAEENDSNWWEQDVWSESVLTELGAVPPVYNASEARYEISTPEQLLFLSGTWKPEDGNADGAPDAPCNGVYVLTADLDMAPLMERIGAVLTEKTGAPTKGYMPPIAALADAKEEEGVHCAFFGTLDGQGHVIRNIRIVRMGYKYCGLFGNIGHDFGEGFVYNLGILDAEIVGLATCGILTGSLYGDVENIVCTGTIDCLEKTAGGLAGKVKRNENGYCALARNCFVYCDIVVRGKGVENGAAGGVSGSNSKGGQIVNCFVGGSIRVLGDDAESVAGVVGNLKGGIAVDNNVMMLRKIDAGDDSADVGLLCGSYSGETGSHLHNNYVWDGALLLGSLALDHPADAAYTDVSAEALTSYAFYAEEVGWDFDSVWTWVDDIDRGYPMLAAFAGKTEIGAKLYGDLTVTEPVVHLVEPAPQTAYEGDEIVFEARVLLPDGMTLTDGMLRWGTEKKRSACKNELPMTVTDGVLSAQFPETSIGTRYYYLTATVDGEKIVFPTEGTLRLNVVSSEAKYAPKQITVSPGATVSEVGVNWVTEADGLTGSLQLRKAGSGAWEQTVPVTEQERVNVRGDHGTFTSYSVDLVGLEPGTTYEYMAVTNSGAQEYRSAIYTFTTLPAGNAFSFVVVSDLQATSEEGYYPYLYTTQSFFDETLHPNFVVNLGDLTEDDTMAQWRYLFDVLGTVQATKLTAYVPGNHESKGDVVYSQFKGRTNLPKGVEDEMLGETTSAFIVGNVCFVTLNTEPYSGIDGTDAAADKVLYYELQKEWARAVFEASGCEWRVIFAHAGLVQKDPEATAFLEQMCEELDVDLFFNGHIHNYFRATVDGAGNAADVGEATTFITVSPMGEKFDDYGGEIDDVLQFQTGNSLDTRHYFVQVTVSDAGVTVTAYRRVAADEVTKRNCGEYEVIDSFTLASKNPPTAEQPTATEAPAVQPTDTPSDAIATEAPSAEEPGGGTALIWIGVCAAAIAAIVLVIVLYRRKEQRDS